MKVLFINKYLYQRGGAEKSMLTLANIIEEFGHSLHFFGMQTSEIDDFIKSRCTTIKEVNTEGSFSHKVLSAHKVIYSFEVKSKLGKLLKEYKPDIVHIDNIYHQMGPFSVVETIKRHAIPSVLHLRDYKVICPNHSMLNDMTHKICEECKAHKYKHGKYYKCLMNRCVKGSLAMSALAAIDSYFNGTLMHTYEKIDRWLSPSKFLIKKFKEFGVAKDITYFPNVEITPQVSPEYISVNASVIYVGRLSLEKGLLTLLKASQSLPFIKFVIVGQGPQRSEIENFIEQHRLQNIELKGHLKHTEVLQNLKQSFALILPSEWYENNPRTIFEAFKMGKPVIGCDIGGIPELVHPNETGILFPIYNYDKLREAILYLWEHPNERTNMGMNGYQSAIKEFGKDKYIERLENLYKEFNLELAD